jgi:hypothetical protein
MRCGNLPSIETKAYHGRKSAHRGSEVWVSFGSPSITKAGTTVPMRQLDLRLDVRNHSPSGFGWGYGGSGAAQLALALLIDALGDVKTAERHYQDFKQAVVTNLPETWTLTAKEIKGLIQGMAAPKKEVELGSIKLCLGQILITDGANAMLAKPEIDDALKRHEGGDWGDLEAEDWAMNDHRLTEGGPVASIYTTAKGIKFYVLTEADRITTTVLLPEEY